MYKPLIKQKLIFFGFDLVSLIFAFAGAFYIRLGGFYRTDFPFGYYIENALFIIPLWLFFLAWGGRYSLREKSWSEVFRVVAFSSLVSSTLFVLIFFFRREVFFSRAIVLLIFGLGTVLGMVSYFLERLVEKRNVKKQKNIIRILVIGANRAAEQIVRKLLTSGSRHMPVAILAPFGSSKTEISGVPIVGKLDALERVTQEYKVNEILLCDGSEQMLNLLAFAEGRFLGFHVSPETLGVFRENISPEMLSGKTILTLQHSPLFGWGQFWKRGFDFLLALLSLGIVSPVFLVQKVFKGSEKLFQKEQRIGAGGRKFDMISYKRSDSIIRNLPNIFNILKGEMSFVGPRPALKEQWESLPPHFKRRMILRPGILGLWQLRKIRGQKDNFDQMYKDDMQYIHHWSFGQDMAIICMSLLEFIKKIFYKK